MNTLRLHYRKFDLERVFIAVGMALMETTGLVLLICGLFGIRIF